MTRIFARPALAAAGLVVSGATAVQAQTPAFATAQSQPLNLTLEPAGATTVAGAEAAQQTGALGGITGYFSNWFVRVQAAQDSQPHWITPLVTVTPRLEQEVRYDQFWETRGNGSTLDVFDGNKGLELIPTETNEVLINPPAYQYKGRTASPANGWLDDQFLVVKQRLFTGNEQNGNYIVTAFLGLTAASGNRAFTNKNWVVTPTISGGKGWGNFDIQATAGIAIPFKHQNTVGDSVLTNITFQYHLLTYFWPEFEVNDTYWVDGKQRGGKNQVLLTPGIVLGRFEIYHRVKATIGGGYQFAVAPRYVDTTEQTPAYYKNWILSARVSF